MSRAKRKIPSWLGTSPDKGDLLVFTEISLGIVLWLTSIRVPELVTSSVDPSWQAILAAAFSKSRVWGESIVFTYGPWGWLECWFFPPGEAWLWLVGSSVYRLAISAVCLRAAFGLRRVWGIAFLLSCLILFQVFPDVAALMATFLILRRHLEFGTLDTWGLVLLALIAQSKIVFLAVAIAGFALGTSADLAARRPAIATVRVGIFAAALALWWKLAGQSWNNVDTYLSGGLEIVSGYADAMWLAPKPRVLVLALIAAIACIVFVLSRIRSRSGRPQLMSFLLAGMVLFIGWRHGFCRADAHSYEFFALAALLAIHFSAQGASDPRQTPHLAVILLSCGIALIKPMFGAVCGIIPQTFDGLRAVRACVGSPRLEADLVAELAPLAHSQIPTDVIGFEQGAALRAGLVLDSRPVPQGYSAYTRTLLERNAAHFVPPGSPPQVLMKLQTIDDRVPMQDDSLALLEIRNRYRFVDRVGGFARFVRSEDREIFELGNAPLVYRGDPAFGERLRLPIQAGQTRWLRIVVRPTLVGRIRSFIYQPAAVFMTVELSDGSSSRHRVIPGMASVGFIASPWLVTTDDFVAFCDGRGSRWPIRVMFETDSLLGDLSWERISVELLDLGGSDMRHVGHGSEAR